MKTHFMFHILVSASQLANKRKQLTSSWHDQNRMRTKNRTNEIYELVAGRKVSNHPEVDAIKFKNALELKLYEKPSK